MLNYPNSPTTGQIFNSWRYDGTKWGPSTATIGIADAPSTGVTFGRNNGAWTDITATTGPLYVAKTGDTMSGGLSFGTTVAPGGPLDLSRHIALFSGGSPGGYGFSITDNTLNVVTGGTDIRLWTGASDNVDILRGRVVIRAPGQDVSLGLWREDVGEVGLLHGGSGELYIAQLNADGTFYDWRAQITSSHDFSTNGGSVTSGYVHSTGTVDADGWMHAYNIQSWSDTYSNGMLHAQMGGGNIGANNCPLRVESSPDASISFLVPGVIATNMGMRQDAYFEIGGWSWGRNRMLMDGNGNVTFAGSVTGNADVHAGGWGIYYMGYGQWYAFQDVGNGWTYAYRNGQTYGSLQPNSASEFKQDIAPSHIDCLDVLRRVPISEYRWRDAPDTLVPVGLVADELHAAFAPAVRLHEDKPMAVDTNVVLATVIGALQQIAARLDAGGL